MWPALCTGLRGLKPGLSTLPAKYRLILVTCDAAPANQRKFRGRNFRVTDF